MLLLERLVNAQKKEEIEDLFNPLGELQEVRLIGIKQNPAALVIFKEYGRAQRLKEEVSWLKGRRDVHVYSDKKMCEVLNGEEFFESFGSQDLEWLLGVKRNSLMKTFLPVPRRGTDLAFFLNLIHFGHLLALPFFFKNCLSYRFLKQRV